MSSRVPLEPALSPSVRGLAPSATIAINDRSNELIRSGRRIFKLGLGQSPFPVPASVVEQLRAHATRKEYLPALGLSELRAAVADYHVRRHALARSADDVMIGPGSKELMFLLQVVSEAEIIVPTPAWVSYAPQARILGRRVTMLHSTFEEGWRLDPALLDRYCSARTERGRIIILNYPSNPTGASYTRAELAALAEIARKHGLIVLSDEIYGELDFNGRHASIAPFYPEGTIISSGLSKWCGAGGWRLGTFNFPRELRTLLGAMSAVATESFTSTSAPIQCAAVRAFQLGDDIELYLVHARAVLSALLSRAAGLLRAADVRVVPAAGGFYLFPDFGPHRAALARRGIQTSADLAVRLLDEADVAALPGVDFGCPPDDLTLRLALVDFDGAKALEAASQLAPERAPDDSFVDRWCTPVVEGTRAIVTWLQRAQGEARRRPPAARPETK